MKPLRTVRLSIVVFALGLAQSAAAQVVVSMGVEEVYDDNLFLESGNKRVVPEGFVPPEGLTVDDIFTVDNDGKIDDDFITNVFVDISTARELGRYGTLSADVGFGALIFADLDDENRLTLDSLIQLDANREMLPNHLYASLNSDFNSGGANVAVAEGTAARQVQTHTATFAFGLENLPVANQLEGNLGYNLVRHDFLGEFVLSDRPDNRLEEEGSDFFANTLAGSLVYALNQTTDLDVSSNVTLYTFSTVNSNDNPDLTSEELDRFDYSVSTGIQHAFSERLQGSANVGVDFSTLVDTPMDEVIEVTNPDGTTTSIVQTPDDTSSSLAFSGRLDATPFDGTGASLVVVQSSGVDTDGSRIIIRSVGLNLSQDITDRLQFGAGGRYMQFDQGDSLSDSTDRYSLSTSLRYALTESLSLSAGWNYTNQDASGQEDITSRDQDYESNRFYVAINAGLVGIPG
ncbi:MAG: hypothetical protein KDD44_02810 [Bdellovibrionales bacterium]|nr:hypothetical protein [Bdellovibrionales bacterium]